MGRTMLSIAHFLMVFSLCSLLGIPILTVSAHAEDKDKTPLEELKKSVFNFDEVSPGIYRSGLIFKEDAPLLNKLGVKTVVSFYDNKKYADWEKEFLESSGIRMIWIPWAGIDRPNDKTIEHSLSVMDDAALRPLLVHCQRGAERTGVTVAAWRVTRQGWTAAKAYEEMKAHKFRSFRYGHLKKYLYDLAYRGGDSEAKINNAFERVKTDALSAVYQIYKSNPFCSIKQGKVSEN